MSGYLTDSRSWKLSDLIMADFLKLDDLKTLFGLNGLVLAKVVSGGPGRVRGRGGPNFTMSICLIRSETQPLKLNSSLS
jgi:hypothetical protein